MVDVVGTVTLILAALLSSSPSAAGSDAPPAGDAVLVMDLRAVDVAANQAKLIDGLVATAVSRRLSRLPPAERPAMHTFEEFRTLADVEAQRSVSGCDQDSASCLAEVAGALGARYVVSGTLGALGSELVLQLTLLDTRTARTLARGSASGVDVAALRTAIDGAVAEVMDPIVIADDVAPAPAGGGAPWGAIVGGSVAGLGVVGAVVGFGGLALLDARLAPTSTASLPEKEQALKFAWPALWVGVGGAAVAVTGTAVAVLAPGGE